MAADGDDPSSVPIRAPASRSRIDAGTSLLLLAIIINVDAGVRHPGIALSSSPFSPSTSISMSGAEHSRDDAPGGGFR
jgi:hypothetical protein